MHVGTLLRETYNREPSWSDGFTGTSVAMAHRNPVSSRAMATVTTWACFLVTGVIGRVYTA